MGDCGGDSGGCDSGGDSGGCGGDYGGYGDSGTTTVFGDTGTSSGPRLTPEQLAERRAEHLRQKQLKREEHATKKTDIKDKLSHATSKKARLLLYLRLLNAKRHRTSTRSIPPAIT
jgi:hypothetical protein